MFNSGILDVVIGLVVIYLQLSLVCTAVHELIASGFKKRAKELERGLGQLLSNPQLVAKFYSHPLIKGLRPDGRKPSYIPSPTFAVALMDIVRRHSFDGTVKLATQAVTEKTAEEIAAQAALNTADTALVGAKAVCDAAKVLAAAGSGDRVANARAVQEAANQQAAAEAAQIVAQTRQNAATKARTDAEGYVVTVTTEAATAKAAESDAQVAEAAAIKTPADEKKTKAAAAARRSADEAADKLAPSASSLLTEAREKVASVQD
ncbi:MAG TPA: hypothetical protein VII34_09785, partial [Pyrinomonadaceae bacterium]